LLELLADAGNRLAVAVVAEPNPASTRLHERLGFDRAGTVPDVGEKLGRLWSTTYWYRRLSTSAAPPHLDHLAPS
jgi:phosphinothricin acetyltransferase